MPWLTTKDGRHFNTDWMDEEEKKKYAQIIKNEVEAAERAKSISPYSIWSSSHLSSYGAIAKQFKDGKITKEKYNEIISGMNASALSIAGMMDRNKTIVSGQLYKTANGFILKDANNEIFMDDNGVVRKTPKNEMQTAHGAYPVQREIDAKERQINENKKQADALNNKSAQLEKPILNTDYYKSTTPQMKQLVTEVYEDMQKEFPDFLGKAVEFDFYNGGGFEAIGDSVSLDGRYMKQVLQKDNKYLEMYVRSTVAHELTHTIQQRMGKARAEEISTKILDTAIDRYVKENPNATKKQVLKDLKKAYGLRTLDCDTSRRPMMERMAVAVESYYMDKKYPGNSYTKKDIIHIGYYVAEELKHEMGR